MLHQNFQSGGLTSAALVFHVRSDHLPMLVPPQSRLCVGTISRRMVMGRLGPLESGSGFKRARENVHFGGPLRVYRDSTATGNPWQSPAAAAQVPSPRGRDREAEPPPPAYPSPTRLLRGALTDVRTAVGLARGAMGPRACLRAGIYMTSGAETPMSLRATAKLMRTASQAARRAFESASSTGCPLLGSTWQLA